MEEALKSMGGRDEVGDTADVERCDSNTAACAEAFSPSRAPADCRGGSAVGTGDTASASAPTDDPADFEAAGGAGVEEPWLP